ncbi:hypothetical protein K2Z84_04290 [Candidatus Binatia bacterium]|nr:hypothetical protein [Candidatus Binatia bacterium]
MTQSDEPPPTSSPADERATALGADGTLAPRWTGALAATASLIYVLSCFVRATTAIDYGPLDSSWLQTLHLAFVQGLQFGRDVIIVLGPWGFLFGGHHPATTTLSALVWGALAVAFWAGTWRLARHLSARLSVTFAWTLAFTAAASVPAAQSVDGRMTAFVVLVLLLHFFVDRARPSAAQLALVVALGLLALAKFTVLALALLVIAVVSLDLLLQRRVPWLAPVWIASVVLSWLAAGQRIEVFPEYLLNSWRLSSGYTDAMSLELPGGGLLAGAYAVIAAAVVAIVAIAGRAHGVRTALLAALGVAGIAALTFKNGYVRHDFHDVGATMALVVLALASLAVAWPEPRVRGGRAVVLAFAAPLAALSLAATTLSRGDASAGLVGELAGTLAPSRFVTAARLLTGSDEGAAESERRYAVVRQRMSLPPVEGDIDAYPWNQLVLFAHGLPYRPRPVTQSYSTYTPELAELNAAYLRSGAGTQNVLFEIAPTDGRLPALEDGRAWPELLARYDYAASDGTRLLLKRAPVPRLFETVPVGDATLAFGDTVSVPPSDGGLLWARIDIEKTALGELVSAVWKLPQVDLTVSLRGGTQHVFRIIPGMARSGFVLSPLVQDIKTFALLRATEGIRSVAANDVVGMTFTVAGEASTASPSRYYEPSIRVRLSRLVYAKPGAS